MSQDEFGSFSVDPAGPFEAGTCTTITFTYTVGSVGLKRGGRLRIGTPNMGWGKPLVLCPDPIEETVRGPARRHNPWKPLNTTFRLETNTDAWVRMWTEERGCSAANIPDREGWEWAHATALHWRWWINADVEITDFEPGDRIVITYGDTDEHPFGVRIQPWPEEKAKPFVCAVDVEGDGELRAVSGSPVCPTVVSGPPELVVVVGPSIVSLGDPFTLRASVLDRNLTPPSSSYDGPFEVESCGDVFADPGTEASRGGSSVAWHGFLGHQAGVGALRGHTSLEDTGLSPPVVENPMAGAGCFPHAAEPLSNPILVSEDKKENLYWGDLHAQCKYHCWSPSEGRGASTLTPAELHQYAREASLLDFVAICNSACPNPDNPGWEETQQAAIDAYEPGRYVTFKGWERGLGVQGDRCLVYREVEVEPNFAPPRPDEQNPTSAHALLRFCRESPYQIMTINHSFMKYLDWHVYDPEIDRVIEIYSCWGSYESRNDNPLNSKRRPPRQSAMYALSLGYTPGFLAAGDSHVGYPGRSLMYADPNWCQNWKAGLAAVYAPELTREALWDAIYNRQCYGTTGARIILRFHINGEPMGSILARQPDDNALCNREIKVTVCGTDYIRRVDIMKNNGLFHRLCPKSDRAELAVTDRLHEPPTARDWYYVRVFQADGNASWSSPIYIGPEGVTQPSVSLSE